MFRAAGARLLRPAVAATTVAAAAGTAFASKRDRLERPGSAPALWSSVTHPALVFAEAASSAPLDWSVEAQRAGAELPGLPQIKAGDVRLKNGKGDDGKIWVGYGKGVYDVTEFASVHPGGNYILLAAGGPLEPHWRLYGQHKAEFVMEILEDMRVGNLLPDEQWIKEIEKDKEDATKPGPYADEPKRSASLIVQSEAPFNAEPEMRDLVRSQITPTDLFYVRNHMPVPNIRPENYRLEIVAADGSHMATFSLEDLQTKFQKHVVAATVQCAGNRRNELNDIKKVKGGSWDAGAISNATWGGVRLSDVLENAEQQKGRSGGRTKADHVCLEGLDADPSTGIGYCASVPMDILNRVPDVLLAYEMNGETLPRDHGYPIRAVVPGVVGARCVKWLGKVELSDEESTSHWQRQDYRCFSPDVDWDSVDFDTAPSIQEMPIVSAICDYEVHAEDGTVSVSGYAWSGDGKAIIRVDISADGGKTWKCAQLREKESKKRNQTYDWTLWDAKVDLKVGEKTQLVCKAVDSCYNTQPESAEAIWNLRGLLNNAWHRVDV